MTPEDAPILDPAPQRNERGQFVKGESGNPGAFPRRARLFRKGAAEVSDNAMELLRRRVQDAIDAPYKRITVGRGEDAVELAVPQIADRDLATFLELAAKHGGRVTAVEMARLLLDARKTLQTPEEWDRFARLVDPDYEPPEELDAIEEEPKP